MLNTFTSGSRKSNVLHQNSENINWSLGEIENKINLFLKELEAERESMQKKLKKLESAAEQDKSALKILMKENEELQMLREKNGSRRETDIESGGRRKSLIVQQSSNEEALRAELSNIESLCQQQNILIAKYKEALKKAKEEAAQQSSKVVNEQMQGLESTNKKVSEELEMAHREIRKMKISIQELENSNQGLTDKIVELERNLHPMKKELDTQRMKVETLENIIEITNAENLSLRLRGKEEDNTSKIGNGQSSQKKQITGAYINGGTSTKKLKSLIVDENTSPLSQKKNYDSIDLTDQEDCQGGDNFEGISVGRITGSMHFKFRDEDIQNLLTNREFKLEPVSQHIQTHYSSHFNPKSTQSTSLPPRTVAKEFEEELQEFRRMEGGKTVDRQTYETHHSGSEEFKSANLFRNEISESFGKHN
jgi:hypothetical protein